MLLAKMHRHIFTEMTAKEMLDMSTAVNLDGTIESLHADILFWDRG